MLKVGIERCRHFPCPCPMSPRPNSWGPRSPSACGGTLARAILRAAAGDPDLIVPSPTFTLVEVYETARGTYWHFDLYRLETPQQVYELGWEEALAEGIVLVEWPQRLGDLLPKHLSVTLEMDGDGRRALLDV